MIFDDIWWLLEIQPFLDVSKCFLWFWAIPCHSQMDMWMGSAEGPQFAFHHRFHPETASSSCLWQGDGSFFMGKRMVVGCTIFGKIPNFEPVPWKNNPVAQQTRRLPTAEKRCRARPKWEASLLTTGPLPKSSTWEDCPPGNSVAQWLKIDLELAKPALLFQHLSTHLWWSWPRIILASRYMGFIEVATSCFLVTGMQTSCCATLSSWFPVASLAQQQNHEVATMTLQKACLSSICNFAISASRCLGTQNRGMIVMSGKAVFTRFSHSERLYKFSSHFLSDQMWVCPNIRYPKMSWLINSFLLKLPGIRNFQTNRYTVQIQHIQYFRCLVLAM